METVIPVAIKNLRLIGAFRGLAVKIMDCITSSEGDPLYVVDDDVAKFSRFARVDEIEDGGFTAYNPDAKTLHLLSIDNRLMCNVEGGIADGALFSTDDFTLIEFKTNAEGRTDKSIEDTYDGAIRQIKNTVRIFNDRLKSVGIDFLNQITVTPHIVVSPKFPRSSAREQNYMLDFFESMGLELSFEDSRIF